MKISKNKNLTLVDEISTFWQSQCPDADTNVKAETGISEGEINAIEQQYRIELPETFKLLYQHSNGTTGLDSFRFIFWPFEIVKEQIAVKDEIVWISFCEYFGLYTYAIGINKHSEPSGVYRFGNKALLVTDSFDEFLKIYLYQHDQLLLQ